MSARIDEMKKQLQEMEKVHNQLSDSVYQCMKVPDGAKVKVYDQVVPLLQAAIKNRLNAGREVWNWNDLKISVTEKLIKAIFGEDILDKLEKF